MKKIFFNSKFYSLLTIILALGGLSFSLTNGNRALADGNTSPNNYTNDYVTFETIDLNQIDVQSDTEIQPTSTTAVLIFIGGILAGYIVDGILIRTTGSSGGEWVAKALSFSKANPKCTNIYFSKATGKPICHSGSGGGF